MNYDELYGFIGEIGVYQVCIVLAMSLLYLSSIDPITMIFVGADMPHWCHIGSLTHLPFDKQKYIGIPYSSGSPGYIESPDEPVYSSCEMYDLNYSSFSDDELYYWNRTLMIDENTPVVECSQWVYDQTIFVSTIINRVC